MLSRFSRILVVDDSSTTRHLVKGMLNKIGYTNVDEAGDGAAALKHLQHLHYALVISDWLMEPLSGLELLIEMRRSERWSRTPFIMITARSQKRFMEIARDQGATHFLAKPFSAQDLGDKINAFID